MSGRGILLIGAGGQIGWELCRTLAPLGTVVAAGRSDTSHPVDLSDPDRLRQLVRRLTPTVIVNAAAYTAVDRAEEEPALARAINAVAPAVLAEEAERLGALLVHYSTDYVFDGTKGAPYLESDATAPLNVYGQTKRDGEEAVAASAGAHLILRTSWVYGMRGQNFLLTMLRLAREREHLRVVDDQRGVPNWSRLLAEATAQAVALGHENGHWRRELSGLYHLSCSGEASWHEFAARILDWEAGQAKAPIASLEPIPSTEYPTPAKRPEAVVLDSSRLHDAFGLRLPRWERGLSLCLES